MRKTMLALVLCSMALAACAPIHSRLAGSDRLGLIRAAGARAQNQGTAAVSMTSESNLLSDNPQKTVTYRMDGVIDFKRKRGSMNMHADAPDGSTQEVETRYIGEDYYIKYSNAPGRDTHQGRHWAHMLKTGSPNQALDPTTLFDKLREASSDIEQGDSEEIRGVKTTSYTLTIDTAREISKAPKDQQEQMRKGYGASEIKSYPVTVWLDEHDLIRKMEFTFNVRSMKSHQVMELYDYGRAVDVKAPDPSDTYEEPSPRAMPSR